MCGFLSNDTNRQKGQSETLPPLFGMSFPREETKTFPSAFRRHSRVALIFLYTTVGARLQRILLELYWGAKHCGLCAELFRILDKINGAIDKY